MQATHASSWWASCRMMLAAKCFVRENGTIFCRTFPFLCEAHNSIVVRASKPHSSKLTCKSLHMGSTLLCHVYLQSLCETPILLTYLPCDLPTKHWYLLTWPILPFLGLSLPKQCCHFHLCCFHK